MNGIHDMGGMHGFGPVIREENEPLFHAAWEARVFCMSLLALANDLVAVPAGRHLIELMDPASYLQATYYARWLASLEDNLVHQGLLSYEELDAHTRLLGRDPNVDPMRREIVARGLSASEQSFGPTPASDAPRFAVGDAVRVRNLHPTHHTRAPRYTRGKRGVVQMVHGLLTFPDTHAHGLGKHPQTVYNVRFDARELWGADAEPKQTVSIDLWESYLEPA